MTSIFLSPAAVEDDREFGLLFDRRGGGPGGRSGGDRDSGGGRNAPFRFQELGEFRRLKDGQARQFVDDFFQIGHVFDPYMVRTIVFVKSL